MSNIRPIVEPGNLRHFFQESVCGAMTNQHLEADDHTIVYLVNLLVHFNDPDNLFQSTPDGQVIKPLADHFAAAVQAESGRGRRDALRQLGDMALFLAGLFGDRLTRSLVDIDYYIAMGGGAYESLADQLTDARFGAAFRTVFAELGDKFRAFVDVLTEVGDQAAAPSHSDILRLYEVWLASGSPRAKRRLTRLGVPVGQIDQGRTH